MTDSIKLPLTSADTIGALLELLRATSPQIFSEGRVDFAKLQAALHLTMKKTWSHLMRFAESFPDEVIVSTLSRQLGWSHFLEIPFLKDAIKRDFYAEMYRIECWSVRNLRERIGSILFERIALFKKRDAFLGKLSYRY